jgi:hypothetical protein
MRRRVPPASPGYSFDNGVIPCDSGWRMHTLASQLYCHLYTVSYDVIVIP